jgi:hypothetical protein
LVQVIPSGVSVLTLLHSLKYLNSHVVRCLPITLDGKQQTFLWHFRFSWKWVWRWMFFVLLAPCSFVEAWWRFRGAWSLLHQDNHPDDGGNKHPWNVSKLLPGYMVPTTQKTITVNKISHYFSCTTWYKQVIMYCSAGTT